MEGTHRTGRGNRARERRRYVTGGGGPRTVVIVWSLAALLDPASVSGAAPQPVFSWAKHSLPVASITAWVRAAVEDLGWWRRAPRSPAHPVRYIVPGALLSTPFACVVIFTTNFFSYSLRKRGTFLVKARPLDCPAGLERPNPGSIVRGSMPRSRAGF